MDKKKIIWISVLALAVLIIISIVVAIVIKNGSSNTPATSSPASSSQNSSSGKTSDNLPSSSGSSNSSFNANSSNSNNASTPASVEKVNSSAKPGNGDSVIKINNPNDPQEVKTVFDNFIQAKDSKDLDWAAFTDNNGNIIPLDNFSEAVGLKVNESLKTLLKPDQFNVFSCSGNNKNLGLLLNIQLLPDYKGNLYKDELKAMLDWEKTLLPDTHQVLFPGINFSPAQLSQTLVFRDGKYRYTEVALPDNSKGSINYTILDDFVVISNSPACLDKASVDLIGP